MEQHQHLSVNELDEGNFFIFSYLLCFYSLVNGFALWCLMNSHISTLFGIVVDLIVLSNFILSSFFFVDHVIERVFICILVPSLVVSLP
jgi:hypothetical protein